MEYVRVDRKSNTIHIKLVNGDVEWTYSIKNRHGIVLLDVDKDGNLLNIELVLNTHIKIPEIEEG